MSPLEQFRREYRRANGIPNPMRAPRQSGSKRPYVLRHQKTKALPPASELRDYLNYNPITGDVTWHIPRKGHSKGDRAGSVVKLPCGYRATQIGFKGQVYRLPRIIWRMVTGDDPGELVVDHIDGDSTNNAWINLRVVTVEVNNKNKKLHSSNTSGVMGVFYNQRKAKWEAQIKNKRTTYHLGRFDTLEEAAHTRKIAERAHGFNQRHGEIKEGSAS